jgi:hypothetical protein
MDKYQTTFAEKKAYALEKLKELTSNYNEEELNRVRAMIKNGSKTYSILQIKEEMESETEWGISLIEMYYRWKLWTENKSFTEKQDE